MDRAIDFRAEQIRALIDGRMTMTRRPLYSLRKVPKHGGIKPMLLDGHRPPISPAPKHYYTLSPWQKVKPGDRLWVRESHYVESAGYLDGTGKLILYRATEPDAPTTWTRSTHMPRWASRLTLIVEAVKVERLQEISEEDAKAEGVYTGKDGDLGPLDISARVLFADLWNKLHGPGSWEANPEVCAISFRVVKGNIDDMETLK